MSIRIGLFSLLKHRLSGCHYGRQCWRFAYLPEAGQARKPIGLTNGKNSYLLLCD
jgi:hypothetical protein